MRRDTLKKIVKEENILCIKNMKENIKKRSKISKEGRKRKKQKENEIQKKQILFNF